MKKLLVCTMKRSPPLKACGNMGSEDVLIALQEKAESLTGQIEVHQIRCLGHCEEGPNVALITAGKIWNKVSTTSVEDIITFCKTAP